MLKARVTLVEKGRMGGDCLNTGCIPSKSLLSSARLLGEIRRGEASGLKLDNAAFDFSRVMQRVADTVARIAPNDSMDRYTSLGVECIAGSARICSPWEVEVDGLRLTTRAIVIATGARPIVPPIPGLSRVDFLSSETIWSLPSLPGELLVLGGGPIGCEMAQCFGRLGSRTALLEAAARILPREDEDVSGKLRRSLDEDGVSVITGANARAVETEGGKGALVLATDSGELRMTFDSFLLAVGRRADTEGLGLEELGVEMRQDGTVRTDRYLRSSLPTIYACGDVTGPWQFTHAAGHQGWHAAFNALLPSGFRGRRADTAVMPYCVFTEPEVARVGLNEHQAKARGIAYEVTCFDPAELDRSVVEAETEGLVKVLTVPGKDRILGVTLLGHGAGELITEYVLAMQYGLGLRKLLGTVHAYPTRSEASHRVAAVWQRQHMPSWLPSVAARYHRWRRGR
jgi:pyruvate/2-oxoglutarate dehydrogenase complex dihydrolipoamide dehydrogenase (E3) component